MLEHLIRGPGAALPGVILLAGPAGGSDSLAAARHAAIWLARAWVRTGRRTLLADLELGNPSLHQLAGVENGEGVADHFAFGTSFQRLAIPVDGGAWSLVPAGAWVPDPAAVLRAPGWKRLLSELADSDATVLAFTPADAPGVPELAGAFGAVIGLGDVTELPGVRPFSVLATFALPIPPAEPLAAPAAVSVPESVGAALEGGELPTDPQTREALISDLRSRQRAARMAPVSDYERPSLADIDASEVQPVPAAVVAGVLSPEAAATPAQPVAEPAPEPAATAPGVDLTPFPESAGVRPGQPAGARGTILIPPRRSYTPLWWTLAVVALLSLLAGSWHFVRVRLQNRNAPDDAGAALLAPPGPTPGAANQPPPASDTILGYTVSVGEHVRLPSAEQRVGALRAAVPEASYFIAPVVREEALYYDVLAGPVADSATAFALLDTLVLRGQDVRGAGEVRLAPYAFLLGDYATEDSATARVAGLRRLEIPSYTVPLSGPPPRFRVYAGGYTGAVDAEVMKQILQSVGEPDLLVPRVGKR